MDKLDALPGATQSEAFKQAQDSLKTQAETAQTRERVIAGFIEDLRMADKALGGRLILNVPTDNINRLTPSSGRGILEYNIIQGQEDSTDGHTENLAFGTKADGTHILETYSYYSSPEQRWGLGVAVTDENKDTAIGILNDRLRQIRETINIDTVAPLSKLPEIQIAGKG